MSYSFSITAASKTEAKAEVEKSFDKVILHQPCHSQDKAAALANAGAVIDLLKDDPALNVQVNVSGSVSWQQSDPEILYGVSVQCSAHLATKPTA